MIYCDYVVIYISERNLTYILDANANIESKTAWRFDTGALLHSKRFLYDHIVVMISLPNQSPMYLLNALSAQLNLSLPLCRLLGDMYFISRSAYSTSHLRLYALGSYKEISILTAYSVYRALFR